MKTSSLIKVYLILSIGVIAGAQSGNIVRIGDASPITIATYRLLFAGFLMALLANKKLKELGKLTLPQWALLCSSALALGLHFITWIAAVQSTTVANAAILFATNPIFTSIGAIFFFKERFTKRAIIALILGLSGTIIISHNDFSLNSANLSGDLLALVCAIFYTTYSLIGKKLLRTLDTSAYVASIYLIAAVLGLIFMAFSGISYTGYTDRTWLCFILMALIPTMMGHSNINYALKYLKASTVSIATLAEVPIAALVAALAWGEAITWVICVGFVLVTTAVIIIYTEKNA